MIVDAVSAIMWRVGILWTGWIPPLLPIWTGWIPPLLPIWTCIAINIYRGLFCVQWFKLRVCCSCCWYWWNCSLSCSFQVPLEFAVCIQTCYKVTVFGLVHYYCKVLFLKIRFTNTFQKISTPCWKVFWHLRTYDVIVFTIIFVFKDPYVCTIVITHAIYPINIVYTKDGNWCPLCII
jgi:hypothetical protein